MDVSPRALRAVTFRTSVRGYNVDDVDQFLERVAEGVAALQGRLDAATARAEKAESERAVAGEDGDAVQRTLVLAQRTADLALKEAKEEATRLVDEARRTADRLAHEAQQQLRVDIDRLSSARTQLHDDVRAMQQYVEAERARISAALAELVRKVDASVRKPAPPPPAAKIELPDPPDPPAPPQPAVADAPEPAADLEFAVPDLAEPSEPSGASGASEPPTFERRPAPQPPPVAGRPFGPSTATPKPTGPPPGPRRGAVSIDAPKAAEEASHDDDNDDPGESSGLRRLFGR